MSNHTTPRPTQAAIHTRHTTRLKVSGSALLAALLPLLLASVAHAGTYKINNCPSAPTPNGNAGPWTVFGSPQNAKGTCSGGVGDYIGPRGSSMNAGTVDGVQVTTPEGSGITIQEAEVWWSVAHQSSGADTFAIASIGGAVVGESGTPFERLIAPDDFVLPSTTTALILGAYCSTDDGPASCVYGGGSGENTELQLFGAQLTLDDSTLPTGTITGGALASGGALTGTQSLAYSATDSSSGVRAVKLLVDGSEVAENNYIAQCPYENFLACPATASDTISWNTTSVPDGQHTLEAIVEDAAQNTSVLYDAAITTKNAPTNTSRPTLTTPSQTLIGTTLSAGPGSWTAPAGAGNITYAYQWEDCDNQDNNCQPIPNAQTASYTPAPSDAGHTLRALVSAADNDGTATQATAATSAVLSPQSPPSATNTPGNSTASSTTGAQTAATGTTNGTPTSETAILTVAEATKHVKKNISSRNIAIHRSFHDRALKLTGRLTGSTQQPISGATLDVLQQISGSDTPTLLKHITTGPDGRYTLTTPAGPSRHIEIAYRASSSDPSYTAIATVTETVAAGVRLSIAPLYTTSTGEIKLNGIVYGPIPPQGVIVLLHVFYHDKWLTIRSYQHIYGYFHIAYQFENAIGNFPFQVEIPSGQANFPYTSGDSNIVNVTTS